MQTFAVEIAQSNSGNESFDLRKREHVEIEIQKRDHSAGFNRLFHLEFVKLTILNFLICILTKFSGSATFMLSDNNT